MLLLACALFMFVDANAPPIVVWDESRLAVNALEMHLTGLSLVTTYGFTPDLWNTKPPMMIWLMALSADLLGPSEFAFRLPAMLSALATLALVFAFVRWATKTTAIAATSVVLLAASIGFFGEHGARTGDYDALLCLFTTGYTCLFFIAIHRRRPSWRLLLAAAAMVAGATLTKGIAGLLPGVGIALYVTLAGRGRRVMANPTYILAMIAALTPITLFWIARETVAPGYLSAVWYNDLAGRSYRALDGHGGPFWYYVRAIFLDNFFSAGPIALLAPAGFVFARPKQRYVLAFSICCVAGELFTISVSATKLPQYALPALPWLAIALAITAHAALRHFLRCEHRQTVARVKLASASILIAIAAGYIGASSFAMRYTLLRRRESYPEAGYGALLATLHARGIRRVVLVDPGINVQGISSYTPQLDFYALLWRSRGMAISHAKHLGRNGSTVLASCNPNVVPTLVAEGGVTIAFPGCTVLDHSPVNQRTRQ